LPLYIDFRWAMWATTTVSIWLTLVVIYWFFRLRVFMHKHSTPST
jgi:hypothetical protein